MADGPWVRSSGALLTRWITSSRAVDAGRRPFAGALSPGTEKCYRAGDEGNGNFVAASSRWSAAMRQPNDLSRSLVALGQNSTIIAAVELSQRSEEV